MGTRWVRCATPRRVPAACLRVREGADYGRRRGDMKARTPVVVGVASALSGCSLLYSTSELVVLDASPDAEYVVDADPLGLAVERVETTALLEGTGAGGSRPAILVVHGANLVEANTTVTLVHSGGAMPAQVPVVDDASLVVDTAHRTLAVTLSLPVDPTVGSGLSSTYDVTVRHDEAGVIVSQTLPDAVIVSGLDELTVAPAGGLTGGTMLFSAIDIGAGTLTAAPNQTSPVRLHAASSITIASPISVAAGTPPSAGPHGGIGGMGGKGDLVSPGAGGSGDGPAPGITNGAPGRFEGDSQLTTLGLENRGSGGAGGDGKAITGIGADGGAGGGGGGSIELVAAGDLTVADVSAKGAPGAAPQNANPGGRARAA